MKLKLTRSEIDFLGDSIKTITINQNINILDSSQIIKILDIDNNIIIENYLMESTYLKVLHSKMRNPNLTISTNPNDECCEHIYYNLTASLHNKCRHKISVFNV